MTADYRKLLLAARDDQSYWTQLSLIEFTSSLAKLMKSADVNQKKLSDLLGIKPPSVSKLLRGTENLTIGTMCKLAGVLGAVVHIHLAKKGAAVRWVEEEKGEAVRDTASVARHETLLNPKAHAPITNTSIIRRNELFEIPFGEVAVKVPFAEGMVIIYNSITFPETSNDRFLGTTSSPLFAKSTQSVPFWLANSPTLNFESLSTRPS